jgi:hypothetical protein
VAVIAGEGHSRRMYEREYERSEVEDAVDIDTTSASNTSNSNGNIKNSGVSTGVKEVKVISINRLERNHSAITSSKATPVLNEDVF